MPEGSLGPDNWPPGCLGYAFNLVRPVVAGHRALVLYPMLGATLVFETLEDASAYREYMTQVRGWRGAHTPSLSTDL